MVLHKRIHKKKIRDMMHVPPVKFESKNENTKTRASYVFKFIKVTFSLSLFLFYMLFIIVWVRSHVFYLYCFYVHEGTNRTFNF